MLDPTMAAKKVGQDLAACDKQMSGSAHASAAGTALAQGTASTR